LKNYIGFVNDHSGSMGALRTAAMQDYNVTITAIKDAATREMLDTVVSVVGIGLGPTTAAMACSVKSSFPIRTSCAR
jgi:hypothetical protein